MAPHEHNWQPVTNFVSAAMGMPPDKYACHCGAEKKMKLNGTWIVRDNLMAQWRPA